MSIRRLAVQVLVAGIGAPDLMTCYQQLESTSVSLRVPLSRTCITSFACKVLSYVCKFGKLDLANASPLLCLYYHLIRILVQ